MAKAISFAASVPQNHCTGSLQYQPLQKFIFTNGFVWFFLGVSIAGLGVNIAGLYNSNRFHTEHGSNSILTILSKK
jgi:hypothetical protein